PLLEHRALTAVGVALAPHLLPRHVGVVEVAEDRFLALDAGRVGGWRALVGAHGFSFREARKRSRASWAMTATSSTTGASTAASRRSAIWSPPAWRSMAGSRCRRRSMAHGSMSPWATTSNATTLFTGSAPCGVL